MLPMIFVMPLVQLLVLVNAATFEIKNIDLIIVDKDLSSTSRELTSKFNGSPFFNVTETSFSVHQAEEYLYEDKGDLVLVIPENFEKKLVREQNSEIQLLINAIDGVVAGLSSYYATSIIASLNKDVITRWFGVSESSSGIKQIKVEYSHWYNPELNYKTFMVPGILVLLITNIGLFLAGMNLVREKEIGTIEQINVTPIKKHQFIIGKLIPFWIISIFELALGLVIGKLVFDIPIIGSLWLIFGVTALYMLVVLAIGLFISTITENQLQAMFFSFFFNLVFILMSGLFTAVESMPEWGQILNKINPIAYFIRVMRMVLLKGSGFTDIIPEIISLSIFAVFMFTLAVLNYKKTS
jgi:ABC-2 type transport system permease protein